MIVTRDVAVEGSRGGNLAGLTPTTRESPQLRRRWAEPAGEGLTDAVGAKHPAARGISATTSLTRVVVWRERPAVAIENGALRAGLLLLAACALPEMLDGAVPRIGTAGPSGAFFDSVSTASPTQLLLGASRGYLSTPTPGGNRGLPLAVLVARRCYILRGARPRHGLFDACGG